MNWTKLFSRSPGQLMNVFRTRFGRFSSDECRHDPTDIMVFVTTRCNLTCFTCPFRRPSPYSPAPGVPDITPEFFRQILDTYSRATMVGLVGGEPLLHPNLLELITIADNHRMTVNVSTNGLLLSEDTCNRLLNSPLGFLNISLDAASPEEYGRMRGGSRDVYARILSNARRFADLRRSLNSSVVFLLSFVTDDQNLEQIPDFARLARDIGADQVFCQNILSYECSDLTRNAPALLDTPDIRARLESLDLPSGIAVSLPSLVPVDDDCRCVKCHHPFRMLTVDGGGNMSPCCVIPPHPRYGSIHNELSGWHAMAELKQIRTDMIRGNDAFADICLGCWDRFSMGRHAENSP